MKLKDIFWVLFISMVPLIELRGAVPVGTVLGLPFYMNYAMSVIGNLIPVPFILLLIPYILDFMEKFKIFRPIVQWVRKKAVKNRGKMNIEAASDSASEKSVSDLDNEEGASSTVAEQTSDSCYASANGGQLTPDTADSVSKNSGAKMPKGAFAALLLFVLIPLPGTGAWTGSLVASLFGFPKLKSFVAITLGVLGCGVIMCLASYGVLGFLSFLA